MASILRRNMSSDIELGAAPGLETLGVRRMRGQNGSLQEQQEQENACDQTKEQAQEHGASLLKRFPFCSPPWAPHALLAPPLQLGRQGLRARPWAWLRPQPVPSLPRPLPL